MDGVLRYGLKAADDYYNGLIVQVSLLADNPAIGIACETLAPGLKRFFYRRHVLFFTIHEERIVIVRVLSEKMDHPRHMQ